jgi:RNA polymerase sigma-70 factor (ECF subfamily)
MSRESADVAFERVFELYYEPVYRLAYRIVGSRDAAEDVAQETFVKLLRRPPALPGDLSMRAWLFAVSTHLAYNAVRSETRRELREERARQQLGDEGAEEDPASSAAATETGERVRLALARLPDRQSRVLLLRHAGLSYRELAAALCVAPGSVGTLLSRAEAAFEDAYRETARGDDKHNGPRTAGEAEQ